MSAAPPDQPPAQEVRVSEYARRALSRWYVIVLAVIVAVGLVVLQGANKAKGQVDATATVYMGQPVTPGGGALFANPPYANLSAVTKLITSSGARTIAATAANAVPGKTTIEASSLNGKVTAHQISAGGSSTAGKPTTGPAYYSIEAQGPWSTHQVSVIANTLAGIVVHKANAYVSAKTAALKAEIATGQASIVHSRRRSRPTRRRPRRWPRARVPIPPRRRCSQRCSPGLGRHHRHDRDPGTAFAKPAVARERRSTSKPRSIANFAAGHSVTAQHKRSSLIVAAVAGLIIGTLLALAWDALRRRQKANGTPAEGATA